MDEASVTSDPLAQEAQLTLKAKDLDLRLKELDIEDKEYTRQHRPGAARSSLTNPAVISAAIAAWASITAAGVTWLSGTITARTQQDQARQQADNQRISDQRKLQAELITQAVKTSNPDQAAENLKFLVNTGLLTGDLGRHVQEYLDERVPGQGKQLPNLPGEH